MAVNRIPKGYCCVYLDLFKIIKFTIIAHQKFENQSCTVKKHVFFVNKIINRIIKNKFIQYVNI